MFLGLYRMATGLGAPLVPLHLQRRLRQGKEEATRLGERVGEATLERPAGQLLWVHAASVGESLAALPLIEALLEARPSFHVLMTSGTVTSAKLMTDRLPPRALHQFAPLDSAAAWSAFFAHWRPALGCLIESEIWPNLILEAERAGLPLALVNGRMSEKSARRWRWIARDIERLLGRFALCLARSQADARRFAGLGAVDVRMLGDLKNASAPLPAEPDALAGLKAAIGERPVWLAASTHPGEEALLLDAHRMMTKRRPDLLTIIVPRHPDRGEAIASSLRDQGAIVERRSRRGTPENQTGIYLADTLGELGLFYRLASLAFIGGSLVPHGGQNPLEAARLGCPPLFGPHTGNFEEACRHLLEKGAARQVDDADELARRVLDLLADPSARDRMAALGRETAASESDVLIRVQEALAPLLDRHAAPARPDEASLACA